MAKRIANHLRLGVFVIAGLFFLVLLLYMIGKNQNLFGSTFILKARFENASGLMPGNNVRFAGINAGTVDEVKVLNDTTIEVTMLIKTKMKEFIRKNAEASVGSDGLMGNKLVNITSVKQPAAMVEENYILSSGKTMDTEEMLKTLGGTNDDIAVIVSGLKTTITKINNSSAIWEVLNDNSLPDHLRASLINVRTATQGMNKMVGDLQLVVDNVKGGKGTLGALLTDTSLYHNLNETVIRIRRAGDMADTISLQVSNLLRNLDQNLNHGKGMATALMKDSALVVRIAKSLENIQKGTAAFYENMEAMKTNFLFRGYYRKQEEQARKDAEKAEKAKQKK
jgi:phospholipid/cholesterol/gamma-HCH transport system substrate-binding protein